MKYKAYPNYKDSGVEWLGEVPEHWELKRLDWASNVVRGNSTFGRDDLLESGEYIALQYGRTYQEDEITTSFASYVNNEFYKPSQIAEYGDTVLISTSETMEDLGHACFYGREDIGLIGGEQFLLKPNKTEVVGKYLYYSAKAFAESLHKYATGTKVYRFNRDDLRTIFVPVLNLLEQQQIADYLDKATAKIDDLISKQERLIALLGEKRQAMISHAVTKGLNPNVPMKDSGVEWLGEVPEHWVIKKLSYWTTDYGSGTTPSNEKHYSNEGIWWVTTGELRENILYSTQKSVTDAAVAELSSLRVHPKGSMLIAMYGATIGRVAVLGVAAASNQACFAIYPNRSIKIIFLKYWFQGFRPDLIALATGGGQPNINADKILNLIIPAPNIEEQQQIADYLDDKTAQLDVLVEKAEKQIELLQEKRTALISAAVTGKIDVREAA